MQVQIDELPSTAFDRLREATEEEVDPVLDLDDVLLDDQLFALVPANLGLETLDSQVGAAGCFLPGLGDLEASLLKRDDSIEILKPFVECHEPVIILGNLRDQSGHDVVPPLTGGEVPQLCRVPGITQLPPDVQLPGDVGGEQEISRRIGKALAREIIESSFRGS